MPAAHAARVAFLLPPLLFTRLPCCGLFTSQVSDPWLPFDFCLPPQHSEAIAGASQDGRVCVSCDIKGSQAFWLALLFLVLLLTTPSLLFFTPEILPDFSYMTCQQFSWIAHVSTHNPQALIIFLKKVPFLQLLPL